MEQIIFMSWDSWLADPTVEVTDWIIQYVEIGTDVFVLLTRTGRI